MRILIVDDDPDIIDCLKDLLIDAFSGASVVAAADGSQALDACLREAFHLICTDYSMPVMNGLEFIRSLRQQSSPNQTTGVIFFSGYTEAFRQNAEALDNVYFVEKPLHIDSLVRTASLASKIPLKPDKTTR